MVDRNKDPDIYLSMKRFYKNALVEEMMKEDGDIPRVLGTIPNEVLKDIVAECDAWDYLSVEQSRMLEEDFTPTSKDAISPNHYKDIIPGYEYMDLMVHMLDDLGGIEAHLVGQIYKYLMRYGMKDDKLQELGKVHWYLTYLMMIQDASEEDLIRVTQDIASRYP